MEPGGQLAADLHAGGRAKGGQHRLDIGFDIKHIHRATRAVRVPRGRGADQQACRLQMLLARLTAVEGGANLGQRKVHEPARLIARRGAQQARQKVRAQMAHLGRNRVVHPHRIGAAAKELGRRLIDEAVGDAFIIPQRRNRAAGRAFAHLQRRQDRARHARHHPAQGLACQLGQAGHTRHLFHQIRLAQHIGPPRRRGGHIAVQREPQRGQRLALFGLGDVHADKADHPRRVQLIGARRVGCGPIHREIRSLAAAQIQNHLRRQIQPRQRERRIDSALKAIARVRVDLQRPAGGGNGDRIPERAFQEHLGGVLGAARMFAAHDPGQAFDARRIRNRHHPRPQGVSLAIQRQKRLATRRSMHPQSATLHACHVKDVQGAVQAKGEIVGDIDQGRDRAQPNRLQPRLQPIGRGAVLHAANGAACKMRAALGFQFGLNLHRHRAGKAALDAGHIQRLQHAQPPCRQIARNAPHAQGVGAVRGNLHLDHRITNRRAVRGQPIGELFAHLTRGKFDNAVVLVRQLQLALRRHHPMAFHTANFANAQGHINARHIIARLAQNHRDPGPRIGCSADDLLFALIRHHTADAQTVGIGVLGGL